ncbi:hypothetical protein [Mycolicibacterium brisbanense]
MIRAGHVVLLCFFITSCGFLRQYMNIDYNDREVNSGLATLVQEKKAAKLSDFNSWTWDEVHLFHEYTDRGFIEKTVGAPVIQSNFYDSKASLLVFEDHGKPVKAIGVSGDYLRAKDNQVTWGADVVLKPWGDGFFMLTPP